VPAEVQRFPMPCGPGADQGYHDPGWLRSIRSRNAVGALVLRCNAFVRWVVLLEPEGKIPQPLQG
jgi:hypothetical protein